ncbi:hypothetical protein [uncultured Megasphaera sp.]|uniref:hypothetical protein n=1 Tax=uncultured Megasphaera sp. TaxID=165188 RepID=UPI002670AB0D|nr:hypothetical protein [uncultured Megasphaera sp.]
MTDEERATLQKLLKKQKDELCKDYFNKDWYTPCFTQEAVFNDDDLGHVKIEKCPAAEADGCCVISFLLFNLYGERMTAGELVRKCEKDNAGYFGKRKSGRW